MSPLQDSVCCGGCNKVNPGRSSATKSPKIRTRLKKYHRTLGIITDIVDLENAIHRVDALQDG